MYSDGRLHLHIGFDNSQWLLRNYEIVRVNTDVVMTLFSLLTVLLVNMYVELRYIYCMCGGGVRL